MEPRHQVVSSLPAELLQLLRCPTCGSSVQALDEGYACASCGRNFPLMNGIARFVDPSNYADSFGFQWHRFSKTQLDPPLSEWNMLKKTRLRPEDLKGKLVLDVGCGMGRFAEVATRWGARVIGIDLSAAVEMAARNLQDREFVGMQADVFALPFAPETFDVIYSIGVLHHTPDCQQAFKKLPQYLKPGGTIAIWLYSGYNKWYRFSDLYRKFTHRLSARSLLRFLRVCVPVLYAANRVLRRIPLVGRALAGAMQHIFPVSLRRDPELRVLDTFDWYSPKYQSKHTYEEVFRWFEDCGLQNLTVADITLGVRGQKPTLPQRAGTAGSVEQTTDAATSKPPARQPKASLATKLTRTLRWLPTCSAQALTRRVPGGQVHLVIALADHFEPAVIPRGRSARAPYDEQARRVERWCQEYPRLVDNWRDQEGRPFAHTYFYPAEQYELALLEQLAEHCHQGWGELEIHLHHGAQVPDTAENTRRQLTEFRDLLAERHGCLCYWDGSGAPRYAFVHGNFALANSAGGRFCGVDNELQILAETGCYADMTFPPGPFHAAQISTVNSLYECTGPLSERAAHRHGRPLQVGRTPRVFPLMVQGPQWLNLARNGGPKRRLIENAAFTGDNPPSMQRLKLWKKAGIAVQGRPDWLFIKLHCHSMDSTQQEAVLGDAMHNFLRELVDGAAERNEVLHFVTAREMVNIILAACDGREGNPGEYRSYRLKLQRDSLVSQLDTASQVSIKG